MNRVFLAAILLLTVACATPQTQTNATMLSFDSETRYSTEEEDNGFLLTVYYASGQIIPGSANMAATCRDKLKEVADRHAASRGRKIQPLEDRKIRVSQDRNGFSGMTACTAYTHVKYKRQRR